MHRFPNPSSAIDNFVAVFVATFEQYHHQEFDLDDVVQATVRANLATSSGHMGETAISRSTRRDRSRDPLYNQMKMYAELFRSLGWMRSTRASALRFAVTLLGRQLVEAKRDWCPLFRETALGIAYPSNVLNVRRDHQIRPFATLLRTMRECDGGLTRDEMILGPLSAFSDRTADDLHRIIERVTTVRDNRAALDNCLVGLEERLGIQINTMRNYTRWPLAVMQTLGWTRKKKESGSRREVHRLTSLGARTADRVARSVDIRADQVDQLSLEQRRSLSRHVHFLMLNRSGFDVTPTKYRHRLNVEVASLRQALEALGARRNQPILYSPFQSLSIDDSLAIFRPTESLRERSRAPEAREAIIAGRGSRDHLFVAPVLVPQTTDHGDNLDELRSRLQRFLATSRSIDAAAKKFAITRKSDTQREFYPLVAQLLSLLGFASSVSRVGVNYQRWDGAVTLSGYTVPIEIKSPTEEMHLSTKAVRQAIENKVVLLARDGLPTKCELTSLIVGYQIPRERGDLSTLIDDVHTTFGFNIGVLDLRTLCTLAIRAVTESVTIDERQLSYLRGFLSV